MSADKNNSVHRAKTHIFDEQEMAVPREHIDKIDAENQSCLPANCRSRNKTWRKTGVVYRKLSDSLYHNFTHPHRGIFVIMFAVNEHREVTDNTNHKFTKRCAQMHDTEVKSIRGCNKIKKHVHGESGEDGA